MGRIKQKSELKAKAKSLNFLFNLVFIFSSPSIISIINIKHYIISEKINQDNGKEEYISYAATKQVRISS